MIPNNTIIVSSITNDVRATGDPYGTGVTPITYYSVSTAIVDSAEFEELHNLLDTSMSKRVGAISLDGLFVPYTAYYEDSGVMPHFERPTTSGDVTVYQLHPFNPEDRFGPGSGGGSFKPGVWASGGHNIAMSLTHESGATETSIDAGTYSSSPYFDADFYYRQKVELNKIRSIAHRAPMILSGWGYDVNGVPTPSGESGVLHPNAMWDTSLWKTGPLDARWDDEKKIWVASGGGGGEMIKFRPVDICPGIGSLCDCVYAEVIGTSCTSTVQSGDFVNVWDGSRSWFNMPEELLFNSAGWAHKIKVTDAERAALGSGLDPGPCRWAVVTMDCIEQTGVL